jgi:hypothetical protein
MASHKSRKSRFILPANDGLQQLGIGQSGPVPQQHRSAKVVENRVQSAGRHVDYSVAGLVGPLPVFARPRPVSSTFSSPPLEFRLQPAEAGTPARKGRLDLAQMAMIHCSCGRRGRSPPMPTFNAAGKPDKTVEAKHAKKPRQARQAKQALAARDKPEEAEKAQKAKKATTTQ